LGLDGAWDVAYADGSADSVADGVDCGRGEAD
jgi:hypothetical protein